MNRIRALFVNDQFCSRLVTPRIRIVRVRGRRGTGQRGLIKN
jgi:hypothetical protein